jgi:O-succinylhomoserine sulfhydrylase
MSPFNAWVLSRSLETLDVRMERHAKNALQIAKALEAHPKISFLKYPFLPSHPQYDIATRQMQNGGAIVCFDLKGRPGKWQGFS